MTHRCEGCGEEFRTMVNLRLHDCHKEQFSIRVQVRLITNDSSHYDSLAKQNPGLNRDQPVFPDFDLDVEPGEPVPSPQARHRIGSQLDELFREEHGLWDWADSVSKQQVRTVPPKSQEETKFVQVGSVEVAGDNEVVDTFVTLDELKGLV